MKKRIVRVAVAGVAVAALGVGFHAATSRPDPCTWQQIARHGDQPQCHSSNE